MESTRYTPDEQFVSDKHPNIEVGPVVEREETVEEPLSETSNSGHEQLDKLAVGTGIEQSIEDELREIALDNERQAIEQHIIKLLSTTPLGKIYSPTDFRLDEDSMEVERRIQAVPGRGQTLTTRVESLRRKAAELEKFLENLGPNELMFKERSTETRDRVASIYEVAMPKAIEAYEKLSTTGELAEPTNQVFLLSLTAEEFRDAKRHSYQDIPSNLHALFLENGSDVDYGNLHTATSALIHAAPAVGGIKRRYPTTDFKNGHIIALFDSFDTSFMNGILIPVGEYGENLSLRLAETLRRTAQVLSTSRDAFRHAENELGDGTGKQFVRSKDNNPNDPASMLSFYEGMITIEQTISQLTAIKIEGYEYQGEDKLIDDLINSGIINQFARVMTLSGIIGPMTLAGVGFEKLVTYEDGKFVLNRDLVKKMHDNRVDVRMRNAASMSKEQLAKNGSFEFMSLHGCPAAIRKDGESSTVENMSQFFLEVFRDTKGVGQEKVISTER